MAQNSSASAAVGWRNSPDEEAATSLPYTSTKLKMHLSVHRDASLHSRSNFLAWYAGLILPENSTGSYLHAILSLPMMSDISAQASLTSAFGGTPGSRSLP